MSLFCILNARSRAAVCSFRFSSFICRIRSSLAIFSKICRFTISASFSSFARASFSLSASSASSSSSLSRSAASIFIFRSSSINLVSLSWALSSLTSDRALTFALKVALDGLRRGIFLISFCFFFNVRKSLFAFKSPASAHCPSNSSAAATSTSQPSPRSFALARL